MSQFNPRNERVKKAYFDYLKGADRKADQTINGVRKAISRFELSTGFADFSTFNKTHAIGFKKHLAQGRAARTGCDLSTATILSSANAVKAFVKWLALQPGYRSRIFLPDIEYFNLSEKEVRAAKSPQPKEFPTLEQIRTALFAMPTTTEIERRDQAIFALTALTGMRDNALASLRLKHVDVEQRLVRQDPREVRTKFSKRIDTFWFRIGDDVEEIFLVWLKYLREVRLYGNDHPVFPRTRLIQDQNNFWVADGFEPTPWTNASAIRRIFKEAFTRVNLPYFTPHSFRSTLVHLAEGSTSIEEFKAWSQNLGHESVLTSLASYGRVELSRQRELIRSREAGEGRGDKLDEILALLKSKPSE
jgi:integrase/recombinase XerD